VRVWFDVAWVHRWCKAAWHTTRDDLRGTAPAGRVCTVSPNWRQHQGLPHSIYLLFT